MRLKLLLSTVLVVAGVALPASALGGADHVAANSQTFTDSTGEDAQAPDITTVAVSNDDSGLVTFKVNISNRPALTPDMLILIWLDTDANSATGDPQSFGADYLLQLVPGDVSLFQWNGTTYAAAPSQTSVTFAYDATGATIRASAQDMGKTKAFNFGVLAASGITTDANGNPDFTNEHDDFAPDLGHGFFPYQVKTLLKLSTSHFVTLPNPAKAGKSFAAGFAVTENDTDGPVVGGTVRCAAKVGTKSQPAFAHGVAAGIATCIWKLPAKSKGKYIRGTVTYTLRGVSVQKTFSRKIS